METSDTASSQTSAVPVFRPTMDEFKDFAKYIDYIESQGAHKVGLAKIIPPKEWIPRKSGYSDIGQMRIPSPIIQRVEGREGIYTQYNISHRGMSLADFEKLASKPEHATPKHKSHEELERKYWKNVTFVPAMYGADISGTLTDDDQPYWNINKLGTILDDLKDEYGLKIEGVNTAYLYFGMWKASFAWHTEDMDLYSINYLHFGEPKSWYVIPPEHGKRLERLAAGFFPSVVRECPAFLRHKMTVISPNVLNKYSIPFSKVTQMAGEFIITFPYGYHAGYNHGFNCAESTNFAMPRWIDYGKKATQCFCRGDMVKIKMDIFVKKYQPEKYDLWRLGLDDSKLLDDEDEQENKRAEPHGRQTGALDRMKHRVEAFVEACTGRYLSSADSCGLKVVGSMENTIRLEHQAKVKSLAKAGFERSDDFERLLHSLASSEPAQERTLARACFELVRDQSRRCESLDKVKREPSVDCCSCKSVLAESCKNSQSSGSSYECSPLRGSPAMAKMPASVLSDLQQCEFTFANAVAKSHADDADYSAFLDASDGLWQFQLFRNNKSDAKQRVIDWNERQSAIYPHCAICLYFRKHQTSAESKPGGKIPVNSEILVPEFCFSKLGGRSQSKLPAELMQRKNIDCLLQCKSCKLTVHQHCYTGNLEDKFIYGGGGAHGEKAAHNWLCDRCIWKYKAPASSARNVEPNCSLCLLRGGALKQTDDKQKWAHVVCALFVDGVQFKNPETHSLIHAPQSLVSREKRLGHKCAYCHGFTHSLVSLSAGLTAKCDVAQCANRFHVTCGYVHPRVLYEQADWPKATSIVCHEHADLFKEEAKTHSLLDDAEKPFANGTLVALGKTGKGKNLARIVSSAKQTFYEVDFGDGTFSNDMLPEDILDHDVASCGPPKEGSLVKVRWDETTVYSCVFLGTNATYMYTLEPVTSSGGRHRGSKTIKKSHKEVKCLLEDMAVDEDSATTAKTQVSRRNPPSFPPPSRATKRLSSKAKMALLKSEETTDTLSDVQSHLADTESLLTESESSSYNDDLFNTSDLDNQSQEDEDEEPAQRAPEEQKRKADEALTDLEPALKRRSPPKSTPSPTSVDSEPDYSTLTLSDVVSMH